jgi:hypothetical protein
MGWALCWQRGDKLNWDFRRIILEGGFEILYNQKGSNGKDTIVSSGFGK